MGVSGVGGWVGQPNQLEERLLDQAQAWAVYTPLFGGHSRSLPQGMIFDVQPFVKSLFCPIRQPPMDFLILRPLSPRTGYHFFEGVGGVGGGQKFQKAPSSGEAHCCHIKPWLNGNAANGSNPGRLTVVGGGSAIFARTGFELPTKKSAVGCITIRPLLALRTAPPPPPNCF